MEKYPEKFRNEKEVEEDAETYEPLYPKEIEILPLKD